MNAKALKDGEPCNHPGCFIHITHPCEGCGRIAGRYPADIIADKAPTCPMIAIYRNPKDFPGAYVARLWELDKPTDFVMIADTLPKIREGIPGNFARINRSLEDDPVIVETWV